MIILPDTVNHTIVSLFFWTHGTCWTDRQNLSGYYCSALCIASKASKCTDFDVKF